MLKEEQEENVNNYQKIIDSIEKGEVLHLNMLNTPKEKVLACNLKQLAQIINTKMEKGPCNHYCQKCNQKVIDFEECKKSIIKFLNTSS